MKNSLLLFTLISLLIVFCTKEIITTTTSTTVPPVNGQVTPVTWKNGRSSALSFSFDDNTADHYNYVRPILNANGFLGTFYVVPSWISNWSNFQTMASEGHEIGAHSMTHANLTTQSEGDETTPGTYTYELFKSKDNIETSIQGYIVLTFAYPFCALNSSVINVADKYYISARSCSTSYNSSNPTFAKLFSLDSLFVTWSTPRNSTDDDLDEFNYATNWIQNSINTGSWAIFSSHQVVPFTTIAGGGGGYNPTSVEWFTDFVEWVKAKYDIDDVWVETVANITKYVEERQNLSSLAIFENDNTLQVEITDNLDDSIYNYPVTVMIKVNPLWSNVNVVQDTYDVNVASFIDGTDTVVQFNVVPDGGIITLTKI